METSGSEKLPESYEDVVKRLKRANGHLSKVISMIQQDCSGRDVAQQMQAVVKALMKAKNIFIRENINSCLDENAVREMPLDKIQRELAELSKYL
jgi:DNA-binding FrmR family transcriptional regulator